ncbi:Transcriptional regulator, MarR family [Castellaniella defragrans 65Phen]|uniref:Transcriptional regulator, MarR family n=2 Tax=Castellaniella defragrans TaxID=75697 RepID=W8X0E4_CASD6|nr:Transcriptional regulator, MarR family [Castellaniella defragrans 65Phen]
MCNQAETQAENQADIMADIDPRRFIPEGKDFHYDEFPFYWLVRLHALYTLELERVLKRLKTGIPQRRVLIVLRQHGVVSISTLAMHVVIKPSTLTRILQRMREAGLIEMRTNAEDARVTDVLITAEGEALAVRIEEATHRIFVRGYRGLDAGELEHLMKTLRHMFENLSEH